MKVAMVSEHASPMAVLGGVDSGGQNVHVGALAAALVDRGHRVVVHTRRDGPLLPRRVTAGGGVVVHHVDAGPPTVIPKDDLRPYMEGFADVLAADWAEDPPDVVHAHFWMSGLAAVRAARPLGIPVVITFHALGVVKRRHQGLADTSPPDRLRVERWLLSEADGVIATCHDEVRELRRFGPPPRSVRVIPCGVDLGLFSPFGPAATRGAPHRIAVVGRLVERKGVADVIKALEWLPDTELVVAGGPNPAELGCDPDVVRLRTAARRCGVADRVHFLGRVARAELPALIRSSDAVVSVPSYEPFGMVPLEAMACEVPPVVSAVGGLKETVSDGKTGLLVPPGEPRVLAATLSKLCSDPALKRRLGAAGGRRARAAYSWPSVAAATEGAYRSVSYDRAPASFTGSGRR
ncbi:MAG: glycosyltransferase [Acidobacteriota bacterium]|nr:glycosyltransferase [Acidobacteriota bacterium]